MRSVSHMKAFTSRLRAPLAFRGVAAYATSAASNYTIDASKLQVHPTKSPKQKFTDKTKLLFGKDFTDHMLEIEWNAEGGWAAPRINAFHDLALHPAASSLHYALECFEGMKAYKDSKGNVRLFRPDMNMKRFNTSADRVSLPRFNEEGLLECIKKFVLAEHAWIPEGKGYSLYLRPTLISTQKSLGVGPPTSALLYVIASPVGPYYPTGFKPVKLLADDKNIRAWPGGTGAFKLGSNYASTIHPQTQAAKQGYSQVLWLFDDQVTEVGTMNMFVFWKDSNGKKELVTPPLADGTILPGVTRDSIIQLAKKWGEFTVSERNFTIHDVISAIKENRMIEAFGAGTAAIVSPIESIHYKGTDYKVPINPAIHSGDLTMKFANNIMDIQYGEQQSDWSVVVK